MSAITTYGYNSIQNHIASTFTYLELQDETGTPIKRFSTADGLTITNDIPSKTITYTIITTGDTTFLNKTVAKSVIYQTSTSTDVFATESFSQFTFESAEDELTVKHTIQVPQVI